MSVKIFLHQQDAYQAAGLPWYVNALQMKVAVKSEH